MKTFALGLLLLTAPALAFAHGTPPAATHGGQVQEDSADHWIELVIKGGQVIVYVSDENNKPIAASQLGGKVTLLVGGKTQTVELKPAEGNSLTGSFAPAATGKATAVLSLTVGGKPAQARFASINQ